MGLIDYIVSGISCETVPEKKKKNKKRSVISSTNSIDGDSNMPLVRRANGDVKRATLMEINAFDVEKWGKEYIAYSGAKVYEPQTYEDIKCVLDHIFDREKLIIDLTKLDDFSAQHVIDYVSGACYVLNYNVSFVREGVFYCNPKI